jgi:type VI secretion system secreted protein VgrG
MDLNQGYVVVLNEHKGSQFHVLGENTGIGGDYRYSNEFMVIPAKINFRPGRSIEKPHIIGMQTATVVGKPDDEIYTDEYGRVKVLFHWDRLGRENENREDCSCWVRCAQAWGGNGWGMVFTPRVGDEVLITFMEGDPDWPIIVGSVYNGANMPLYTLPENMTRSVIRTRSTPKSSGFNELRFEDKAGSEEIFLHGEKDWNIVIKNDKTQSIGRDESLSVGNNRTKSVAVNQSESIGGNKNIQVGMNHSENIGANMNISVGANKNETVCVNSSEAVGAAKELTVGGLYQVSVGAVMNETVGADKSEEVIGLKAVVVGMSMQEYVKADRKSTVDGNYSEAIKMTHSEKANEYVLEANKITLRAGTSTIVMDGSSITLKSPKIFTN